MAALNNVAPVVASVATEADMKNYLVSNYNYLVGLFGATGVKADAISTLGASPFPAGTAMLFAQATAPTGWTKSTTHNDKALRVVTGTSGGSASGSVAFSTVFGRKASDASSLSIAQLASHTHPSPSAIAGGASSARQLESLPSSTQSTAGVAGGPIGSGATHTHGLDMRVQYVDVIICLKD